MSEHNARPEHPYGTSRDPDDSYLRALDLPDAPDLLVSPYAYDPQSAYLPRQGMQFEQVADEQRRRRRPDSGDQNAEVRSESTYRGLPFATEVQLAIHDVRSNTRLADVELFWGRANKAYIAILDKALDRVATLNGWTYTGEYAELIRKTYEAAILCRSRLETASLPPANGPVKSFDYLRDRQEKESNQPEPAIPYKTDVQKAVHELRRASSDADVEMHWGRANDASLERLARAMAQISMKADSEEWKTLSPFERQVAQIRDKAVESHAALTSYLKSKPHR
jgi:hypothetical protein